MLEVVVQGVRHVEYGCQGRVVLHTYSSWPPPHPMASGHATYGGGDHGDTRIAAYTLSGDEVRVVHLRGRLARRTDQEAGYEIGNLWIRIQGAIKLINNFAAKHTYKHTYIHAYKLLCRNQT